MQRRDRRIDAAAQRADDASARRPARESGAVASSTNDAIVQSPVQPQTPWRRSCGGSRGRLIGVNDLGVKEQRVERRGRIRHRRNRRVARWWPRRRSRPCAVADEVSVAGPDTDFGGNIHEAKGGRRLLAGSTLPWRDRTRDSAPGSTEPPSVSAINCDPVADPSYRRADVEDRRGRTSGLPRPEHAARPRLTGRCRPDGARNLCRWRIGRPDFE